MKKRHAKKLCKKLRKKLKPIVEEHDRLRDLRKFGFFDLVAKLTEPSRIFNLTSV